MPSKSNRRPRIDDPAIAQRSIVLTLLDGEHPDGRSSVELERELFDVQPLTIADALLVLEREEVIHRSGEQYVASRCARHLGSLGMVCI